MALRIEDDVTRDQVWLRMFIHGQSGAGKSRAALEVASRIFGGELPIVLINTEPGRGKLYADRFKIDRLIELEGDFGPEQWIEALDQAERKAPGGVIIGDSATSEWYGTGGITQIANRFGDWKVARPRHQGFVDRMNVAQAHVIMCCRSKMKHEQIETEEGGRKQYTVVPLGVGPMQDADFQYEFNLVAQIDRGHVATFSGHVDTLVDTESELIGEAADEVAARITAWCSIGTPIQPPEAAPEEQVSELIASLKAEGIKQDVIEEKFAVARRANRGQLHPEYVTKQLGESRKRIEAKAAAKAAKQAAAEKASQEGQEAAQDAASGQDGPTPAPEAAGPEKGAQPVGAPA